MCVYEEKKRLGTTAMGGVSSDSSDEVGRTVRGLRGGADADRWGGGDLDALNVLLGGDRSAEFKWETSTGERGPSSSVSALSSVTMTGRVRSFSLRRAKLKPNE